MNWDMVVLLMAVAVNVAGTLVLIEAMVRWGWGR